MKKINLTLLAVLHVTVITVCLFNTHQSPPQGQTLRSKGVEGRKGDVFNAVVPPQYEAGVESPVDGFTPVGGRGHSSIRSR